MSVYGKIDTYEFDSEWDEYIERLEHFFTANEITDKDKIKSILLTVCCQKIYGFIRNLTSPQKPSDKSYDELKALIAQHLKPNHWQLPKDSDSTREIKVNRKLLVSIKLKLGS